METALNFGVEFLEERIFTAKSSWGRDKFYLCSQKRTKRQENNLFILIIFQA